MVIGFNAGFFMGFRGDLANGFNAGFFIGFILDCLINGLRVEEWGFLLNIFPGDLFLLEQVLNMNE